MDTTTLASQMRRASPSNIRCMNPNPPAGADSVREMHAQVMEHAAGRSAPSRERTFVRNPGTSAKTEVNRPPQAVTFQKLQTMLPPVPEKPGTPQPPLATPPPPVPQQPQLPSFGWTVTAPPHLQQPPICQNPLTAEEPPPVLTVALGDGWSSVRQRTVTRPDDSFADSSRPAIVTRPLTPTTLTSTTRTATPSIPVFSYSSSQSTSSSNTFPTTHPVSSELTTQSEPPRRRVSSAVSAGGPAVEPRNVASDIVHHPYVKYCPPPEDISPRSPATPVAAGAFPLTPPAPPSCYAGGQVPAAPSSRGVEGGPRGVAVAPAGSGPGTPTRDSMSEATVSRTEPRARSRGPSSKHGSRTPSRRDSTPSPSEHGTFTIGRGAPRVSFAGPGNPTGVVKRWPEIPHMPHAIARLLKYGKQGTPKPAVTIAAPTVTKPIVVEDTFPPTEMVYLGSATGDRQLPEWETRRRQENAVKMVRNSLMDARIASAWTRGVDMPLKQAERQRLFTYEPPLDTASALSELCANAVNHREVSDALRDKPCVDPRTGRVVEEQGEKEVEVIMPWDTPPSPDDMDEMENLFAMDDSWKSSSTRRQEQGLAPRSIASLMRIERDRRMVKSPFYRAGHVYSSSMGRAESLIGLPPWMSPETHATGLLLPPPPVVSPHSSRTRSRKRSSVSGSKPVAPSQYIGVTSQMSIGKVRSFLSNGTLHPVKECLLHTRSGRRPLPFAVRAPPPCICRADRRYARRLMGGPPLLPLPTEPAAWRGRITPGTSEETISSRSYSSIKPFSAKSRRSSNTSQGSLRRSSKMRGAKSRRLASLSYTSY